MSGQAPNPEIRALTTTPYRASLAVHPDYTYWSPHWEVIRDCEIGEVEIKRKSTKYLPSPSNLSPTQYQSYLRRAVFFNMTSRTLHALYGTVFRRMPKVSGFTKKLDQKSKRITKDGTSLHLLAKTAVKEVLAVGRYGLLVDTNSSGGDPYIACYTAENIIDWEMGEVGGRVQLIRVVLREIIYDRDEPWAPYQYKALYRVLTLVETDVGPVYTQLVYVNESAYGTSVPDDLGDPDETIIPEVRGRPIDYIPFIVIGPFTNHPDVEKPPMLDIVTLNLSHYMTYAWLEQARYYVASPVYTVFSDGEGLAEYPIGPETVWKMGKDDKVEIKEFNGHGLRSLELALQDKEAQIAAIGGRLMPGRARGAAESDNSLALKERNEQTLLLNIADTVDEGLTTTIRWWADWNNTPKATVENITFELNRDFLLKDIGAREFRAIHQMYADGILPVEVVYAYLRKAEVIPEWMQEDEFLARLNNAKQFPNMVDVLARMKNFPDAKSFHEYERVMTREHEQAKDLQKMEVTPGENDPEMIGVPRQTKDARAAQSEDQE